MIQGKNPLISSTEFDVHNHNLFHFVQKVHYIIIDLQHLSLNFNVDDNIYVQNMKVTILNEFFAQIVSVSDP